MHMYGRYIHMSPLLSARCSAALAGLYTILLLPILYGVWHTNGRSRRGRILHDSRAIVLQQCGQCRWAGEMKRGLIPVETTRNSRISCKGQHTRSANAGLGGLFFTLRPHRPRTQYMYLQIRKHIDVCMYIQVYICLASC